MTRTHWTATLLAIAALVFSTGTRWGIAQAQPATATQPVAATQAIATTQPSTAATSPARSTAAVVIPFEGDVDEFNRDSLARRVADARARGAQTIILSINSYGGLVHAGLDISRFIKQQEDLTIIAYVHQKAISAGAMMAAACNEIVMEPHAQIGAAGVILSGPTGGLQEIGETERAKFESPVLEDFYDSAVRNGHDPLLLRAMVTVRGSVHFIERPDTGERRIVDGDEYKKLIEAEDGWRPVAGVRDPIKGEGALLTLTTDLAQKLGLAGGRYVSIDDFAAERGLNVIATLTPDVGERIVGFLSSMAVRGLLMTVLMFALYMSFSTPGTGAPEAVALTALGILVGVPMLTGYAQWYEIIAIVLGLGLIAVEIFILPGFGIAGLAGLLLVLGGLSMTFVPPIKLPGLPMGFGVSTRAIANGMLMVIGALVASLALWAWLSRYLPKLPVANRLILTTTAGDLTLPDVERPVETGPAIGDVGVTVTDLRPGGTVKFMTESYPDGRLAGVVSESGFVPAGTRVVVREVAGNRVVVRAAQA